MAKIPEPVPERRMTRVQPGVILDHLRNQAEKHNLTFGPDPASHSRCTLGGMIGNNSCGVHSVMSGKTDENIEELEIDRKSTRLNSSHLVISYAVFCLKKKITTLHL